MFLPKNNLPKAFFILLATACLVLSSGSTFAEQLETKKFSLQELLALGHKAGPSYENKRPYFSLLIPEAAQEKWGFVTFEDPQAPFYIASTDSAAGDLPFISSMVSQISPEQLAAGKVEFFKLLAKQHEAWEQKVSQGDITFLNRGCALRIGDLDAFERIFENPKTKTSHHLVYIIIDNFLLQVGLNTKTENFAQDDAIFLDILRSLNINRPASAAGGELFVSQQYKFSIKGPDAWSQGIGAGGKDGEVKFTKDPEGPLPVLAVTTDYADKLTTLQSFAESVIKELRASAEQRQAVFNVIEEPTPIQVNGVEGIRFVYEFVGPITMRFLDCKFMKDNLVVSVMAADYASSFDTYVKDFEGAVNSFTFQ